jgi:3-hydroxybutyryl-CoA dehydrogenase
MKILILGNLVQLEEVKLKFGSLHKILVGNSENNVSELIHESDVIFDFNADPKELIAVSGNAQKPLFTNTVFTTLQFVLKNNPSLDIHKTFGFCGLSTFLNREVLEVCIQNQQSEQNLKSVCTQLETDYVLVKDQVGFVTPRVIGMIINEAYLTAEEGTASASDIDLAMKLGTNYPHGPFEWAKRIGISEVVKLIDATYQATGDDRYHICQSLRNANQN